MSELLYQVNMVICIFWHFVFMKELKPSFNRLWPTRRALDSEQKPFRPRPQNSGDWPFSSVERVPKPPEWKNVFCFCTLNIWLMLELFRIRPYREWLTATINNCQNYFWGGELSLGTPAFSFVCIIVLMSLTIFGIFEGPRYNYEMNNAVPWASVGFLPFCR